MLVGRVMIALPMSLLLLAEAAAQTPDRLLDVRVRELFRIGGVDAPDWASFTEVREVGFGPDGELWIVDRRGARIVRVARDGGSGEDLLRRGRGPGEFQMPHALAVRADGHVLVGDVLNTNLQLLDPNGRLIAAARKHPYLRSADVAWLDGDDFVAVPEVFFVEGEARINGPQGVMLVTSVPLLRFRMGSEIDVHTIASAAYTQPPKTAVQFAPHGFQPRIHWSVHRGRIALADGVEYAIRILDAEGNEIGLVRRAIPARRPSRADRAAARQEARARLVTPDGRPRVSGASESGTSDRARGAPALLRRIESGLDAMTFAERVPVITGVRYDVEGRLWVARTAPVWGQQPMLDLFLPNGAYLGTTRAMARLPDAFGPRGLAALIEKDDFDVPYVRVLQLQLP